MKYISIDIETTGLDPENCQILSIGAVLEDTTNFVPLDSLPSIHIAILHENIKGSMFAINMNAELIGSIVKYQNAKTEEEKIQMSNDTKTIFVKEEDAVKQLFDFLCQSNFLKQEAPDNFFVDAMKQNNIAAIKKDGEVFTPVLVDKMKPFHITVAGKNFASFDQRFLERLPRWKQAFKIRSRILDPAVLFVDWKKDESLPGLNDCKSRSGIKGFEDGYVAHNAEIDARDVVALLRTKYF
jgi:oligoribonuclease